MCIYTQLEENAKTKVGSKTIISKIDIQRMSNMPRICDPVLLSFPIKTTFEQKELYLERISYFKQETAGTIAE